MHFQIKAKGICQISFGATYSYLLSVPPNFLIYYLSQPQTTPISLSIIVLVSSPFFYTLPTFSFKTIDALKPPVGMCMSCKIYSQARVGDFMQEL